MADEEIASVKTHVDALASIPVTLPNDYAPDPQDYPRKFTAFPVELPPAPVSQGGANAGGAQGSISLTIKSLKPVISFDLSVHPTDTIATIKEQLAKQHGRAPPADIQRLLIKGKVLADNKLLKEYDGVGDGTVLNLMIRPGATWAAEDKSTTTATATKGLGATSASGGRSHSRTPSEGGAADQFPVPSLVLVTPSSPTGPGVRAPVPLTLDTAAPPRPSSPLSATDTSHYSETIQSTVFWDHLRDFLGREFGTESDADAAFESFLVASKGSLSADDVARIRDAVGVTGMAGT